ncbi:hypothetical protein EDD16DRAFT_728014 [Pisolithus croceorrhizus]|nr:hypothetical protein EDD16DRAFT_728014 [Pisolithus croceorrhizus]
MSLNIQMRAGILLCPVSWGAYLQPYLHHSCIFNVTVTPGLYRITTQLRPNAPIGIDPYNLAAIKPVVIAIPGFSPEGTTWRVLEEDGQLYLLLVHTAKTRPEDDKVYAYYSEPGERWAIVYHPEREGYR